MPGGGCNGKEVAGPERREHATPAHTQPRRLSGSEGFCHEAKLRSITKLSCLADSNYSHQEFPPIRTALYDDRLRTLTYVAHELRWLNLAARQCHRLENVLVAKCRLVILLLRPALVLARIVASRVPVLFSHRKNVCGHRDRTVRRPDKN